MRLLNLACGGQRWGPPWINTDQLLSSVLKEGTPEFTNLIKEPNYIDMDVLKGIRFPDDSFDGIAAIHCVEHWTCHEAAYVLSECKRVLSPGGILVVSVPDTQYFLDVYFQDTKERAVELFGEPIHDEGHEKFFTYALWRHDHKQILTYESVECLLLKAGFTESSDWKQMAIGASAVAVEIDKIMNRRKFSLEMCAVKSF